MGVVYHSGMINVIDVKYVNLLIDKELWKSAKILAAKEDLPVRLVVAEGLRLLLKQDQVEVDPVQSWHQEAEAGG